MVSVISKLALIGWVGGWVLNDVDVKICVQSLLQIRYSDHTWARSNSKVADSSALNRSQSFTDNGDKGASIVTPSGDTRHCKGAFQFYKKKLGQAFSSSSSSLSSIASSSGTKVSA